MSNSRKPAEKLMTHLSAAKTGKISIITPSLNRVEMLKDAVQSVVTQRYPNYEHIIVDGGSTDGTLEFLKTQPQIKLVCEPDRGMYDALNKGLALASGEVIGFLNTDDLYAPDIFTVVMQVFEDARLLAVAGRAEVFFEDASPRPGIKIRYSPEEQSLLESTTVSGNYFNAWFFRNTVFDLVGGFDPEYKVVGDRDFMLRIALNQVPFKTVDQLAYLYRSHAGSLTFDVSNPKQKESARELLRMAVHYLNSPRLTSTEKRLLVRLHTLTSLALARWHEGSGDLGKYVSVIRDCVRYDLYALPRVLRHVIRTGIHQFARLIRHAVK